MVPIDGLVTTGRKNESIVAWNGPRRKLHLIVLGGGYVGLELSQALRRLGSRVTLISLDSQLVSYEDSDISLAILQLFRDEGIDVMLDTDVLGVSGLSGRHVSLQLQSGEGPRTVEGSDILIALGRTPNPDFSSILAAELAIGR